ncbi:MAG: methyltransferase domain-containing protein [Promethearchaeota archaeon]
MHFERTKRILEISAVLKFCNHSPRKILDLGYGDGQITNALREKGYKIIGLDVSKGNYEKATKSFPECDFRLYDGLNIPFENNSFDTIIMNDVLEHIPYSHMDKLIEKVKYVLEPEGLIYISVTNRYELIEPHTSIPFLTWFPRKLWNILDLKLNRKKNWYHIWDIYPYTLRRLKKFCKKHKLQYENLTYIYVLHKFTDLDYIGNRFLRMIVKFIKKLRLENLFYFLAYKVSVIIFICKKS